MARAERWRRDLVRPEAPTRREELGFLVGGAAVIVAALLEHTAP